MEKIEAHVNYSFRFHLGYMISSVSSLPVLHFPFPSRADGVSLCRRYIVLSECLETFVKWGRCRRQAGGATGLYFCSAPSTSVCRARTLAQRYMNEMWGGGSENLHSRLTTMKYSPCLKKYFHCWGSWRHCMRSCRTGKGCYLKKWTFSVSKMSSQCWQIHK